MSASPQPKGVDAIRIQKTLQKFGAPRGVRDSVVVGAKRMLSPGEEQRRIAYLSRIPKPTSIDLATLKKAGGGLLDTSDWPEVGRALKGGQDHLNDLKAKGRIKKPADHFKRDFLVNLGGCPDLIKVPAVTDLALSDEMLSVASHYLGEVPLLTRLDLWWSPVNDRATESQLYHYDGEDKTQLKFILYLNDVDEGTGPFTLVPADLSAKVISTKVFARRRSVRLEDEAVEGVVGKDAPLKVMGPAGTLACCDTSRCLHYGSRAKERDRFIIMIQFTRFLCPKAERPDWNLKETGRTFSELQKMVLNAG